MESSPIRLTRLSKPPAFAAIRNYWWLVRPRIVTSVLMTMLVASLMNGSAAISWLGLACALIGSWMVIAGAVALNQRIEHHSDARMARTADRPLPAGRLSDGQATRFGAILSLAGLIWLALLVSPAVTLLATASWLVYVAIYTPLKSRSVWQTPLGAIAGAAPVLLGAAATGALTSIWTVTLFGVVYFWQFPHAMAIAWLYRHEFTTAGIRVAPVVDPAGRTSAQWAVLGAMLLIPVSLAPWLARATGIGYAVAVLGIDLVYLGCAVRFAWRRDDRSARSLLWASLGDLPALCSLLLLAAWGWLSG